MSGFLVVSGRVCGVVCGLFGEETWGLFCEEVCGLLWGFACAWDCPEGLVTFVFEELEGLREAEVEVLEEDVEDFEVDDCLTDADFESEEDLTDDEDDFADDDDLAVDEEREFPLDCANESNWKTANADTINIAASIFADNLIIVGI